MIAVQEGGEHDGSEDDGRMMQAAGVLQALEEACCRQQILLAPPCDR